MYSPTIPIHNNCTPLKKVIATIIEVQPEAKLLSVNIYETIEYISTAIEINIVIIPKFITNFKGLVEMEKKVRYRLSDESLRLVIN